MEAIGRANGAPADVVAGVVRKHRLVFDLLRAEPDTNAARITLMRLFQELEPGKSEQEIAREWSGFQTPFFHFGLTYDARATLEQRHCPVLVLHGEKDLLVLSSINLPSIREALATGSNQDVTIIVLPDLNHMFQTCETGAPEEYGRIEETVSPKALHLMGDWILSRVAKPR